MRLSVWFASLALAILALTPSLAASAIYYSPPDNTYGWSAGYGYDRAHSNAREYCQGAGGADCQLVMECDGGYGAVAFSEDGPGGFAGGCGYGGLYGARVQVLGECMVASNALCWTDSLFDTNGNELPVGNFDLVLYTQFLLQAGGYELGISDGEMGPATRTAVQQFQQKVGLEPTGIVDDQLFFVLLDVAGGTSHFVSLVKHQITVDRPPELADNYYSYAAQPKPARSASEELATLTEEHQRLVIAAVLNDRGTVCTTPATSVEAVPPDGSSGIWLVTCREGDHTLMRMEGATMITTGHSDVEIVDEEPKKQSPRDKTK
jgi:hypothetical protein